MVLDRHILKMIPAELFCDFRRDVLGLAQTSVFDLWLANAGRNI